MFLLKHVFLIEIALIGSYFREIVVIDAVGGKTYMHYPPPTPSPWETRGGEITLSLLVRGRRLSKTHGDLLHYLANRTGDMFIRHHVGVKADFLELLYFFLCSLMHNLRYGNIYLRERQCFSQRL